MATFLDQAIIALNKLGIWSVAMPFALAFVLVFGLMQKIKVLGKESMRYNAIIAFVFSMMFVYFVSLPELLYFVLYVVIFAIASIMLMMILTFVGLKKQLKSNLFMYPIVAFFVILLGSPFIDWELVKTVLVNPATIMLAVMILGLWLIVGRSGKLSISLEDEQKAEEKKVEEKANTPQSQPRPDQFGPIQTGKKGVLLEDRKPIKRR
jgi:hypothetical protein